MSAGLAVWDEGRGLSEVGCDNLVAELAESAGEADADRTFGSRKEAILPSVLHRTDGLVIETLLPQFLLFG